MNMDKILIYSIKNNSHEMKIYLSIENTFELQQIEETLNISVFYIMW